MNEIPLRNTKSSSGNEGEGEITSDNESKISHEISEKSNGKN
jgi:hypothetical protein